MTTPITPETTDLELVQRAKAGDLDAFEMLTTRHEQRVYSLAMRMMRQEQDAEDVTQQTFLSALQNLDGFRGEASFSTWLLRIASHAALKVIRKRKGLEMVSLEAAGEESEDIDYVPHPEFIADWRQSPEQLVEKHAIQRLLDEADTGKLLGAQAVGHDGVDKRIDVLATVLKGGMTVNDLAELAYAPPFGSAKDPVNMAGMAAQNVLAGEVQPAQWNEIASLDGRKFLLLDVRRPDERAKGFLPGSIHIPLDQVRARMNELPRDREIIVHCQSGQRSYFACRILTQHGFRSRNLSGSCRTWKTATTTIGG